MKCPKCGYVSFPYLESCSKCGRGLAEERAAFGVYALRPDPPDLVMAYQAAPLDIDGMTPTPALSSLFVDLSHVDEIELEPADAEEPPDLQQGLIPPSFDLEEPADMTLALESAADLGVPPLESAQPPTAAPDVEQVYDLDLEEDIDGLTLDSGLDDSRADEREGETAEYILEVEDELELEIDDLTLEEGEESGEEDDDHR